MPLDYKTIKRLALSSSLSPKDLLALAPQNDPFYVGAKRQLEKGRWFASIYKAMGSPPRCHIRRVHYWLVTTNAVPKIDGTPYENTQHDWDLLTLASKYARYLGLVPIDNIVDRRNPEPSIHADYWKDRSPSSIRDGIDESSIIEDIVSQFYPYNPCNTQPYMIELWAEKSTMNDVLEPICQQYGMNLVTGLGELSITSVYLLAGRIANAKKPVRIFYISDFDPAGECMPVSVARKIEYFIRQYGLESESSSTSRVKVVGIDVDVDVKLSPLLLTADQCKEYNLPRTPIKETEQRKDKFELRHGIGATELDAMEAIYPGKMEEIIVDAITPYFDIEKWNETVRVNREVQEEVRKYLVGGECGTCDGTGLVSFEGLDEKMDSELVPFKVTVECSDCTGTGKTPGKIPHDLMSSLTFDDTGNLKPTIEQLAKTEVEEMVSRWLYDSGLDYIDQIKRYRSHQNQTSDESAIIDIDPEEI